jgi:hypothetical protein
VAGAAMATGIVCFSLAPWQDSDDFPWAPPGVLTPLHGWVPDLVHGAVDAIFVVLLVGAVLAGASALVVRYRRARRGERQQLKWAVLGGLVSVSVYLTGDLTTRLPGVDWWLVSLVAFTVFPLTVALAVLRYRLYDIDRIVSRTVSYGLLTALLVGVYAAGVVGLGGLIRSATGGGGGDLVVAASTLAVAALFGPARRRIQDLVDRRFNRARYDAQQTVEAFAQRLRDEVDLDTLCADLRASANEAIQPRSASVWVRAREVTS